MGKAIQTITKLLPGVQNIGKAIQIITKLLGTDYWQGYRLIPRVKTITRGTAYWQGYRLVPDLDLPHCNALVCASDDPSANTAGVSFTTEARFHQNNKNGSCKVERSKKN